MGFHTEYVFGSGVIRTASATAQDNIQNRLSVLKEFHASSQWYRSCDAWGATNDVQHHWSDYTRVHVDHPTITTKDRASETGTLIILKQKGMYDRKDRVLPQYPGEEATFHFGLEPPSAARSDITPVEPRRDNGDQESPSHNQGSLHAKQLFRRILDPSVFTRD
jgi:hypothetical protein